jgi:uncharacterized membrane protein YheB (UPF0754 family)
MVYSLPFISALIGWFTNWVAVKMMFHPKKKISFGFFDLQGVFPKRQREVAQQIGKMVANELLSIEDIKAKLNRPEQIEGIKTSIDEKINDYLNNKFPVNYPLTSFFFGKRSRQRIREDLVMEVERFAPEIISNYADHLGEDLDIEKMVSEKIAVMDPEQLEGLINGILKKEFVFIETIGAVLGFIIGLFQVVITKL